MIAGTADVDRLSGRAGTARMPSLEAASLELPGAEVLQALYEMRVGGHDAMLPPGLHPTNPPTLWIVAWSCPQSRVGPFRAVQVRVGCRSGPRTRGFVVGTAVDGPPAARDALAEGWGFRCLPASVALARRYDVVRLEVADGDRVVLALEGADPDPLGAQDLEYTASLNLAHTGRGVRLVQVEPRYSVGRAERLVPRLGAFDAGWWGEPLVRPAFPVVASVAVADVTLPPLRFVCRPDVPAHEGTEPALVGSR